MIAEDLNIVVSEGGDFTSTGRDRGVPADRPMELQHYEFLFKEERGRLLRGEGEKIIRVIYGRKTKLHKT